MDRLGSPRPPSSPAGWWLTSKREPSFNVIEDSDCHTSLNSSGCPIGWFRLLREVRRDARRWIHLAASSGCSSVDADPEVPSRVARLSYLPATSCLLFSYFPACRSHARSAERSWSPL